MHYLNKPRCPAPLQYKMDPELRLRCVLKKIAAELGYEDHHDVTKPISSGGANYTSSVFSSILSAPGKPDLKLFVKAAVNYATLRSLIRFDLFYTEVLFYSELLPRYRRLEETYNVPEEERLLLPKYYGGKTTELNEILVFEDLVDIGFRDFNRFACVDWDYASKCVEQLAILHSLSFAYAEKYPEEFDRLTAHLKNGLPIQNVKMYLEKSVALTLKVCHEDNKEKLKKFIEETVNTETFDKYSKPKRRPVLIHGDFRTSNIMHKVDDKDKLQVVLIDHQLQQRGNPLFDLMYFIALGTDAAFRAKYFYKLLDHYYSTLSRALLRLEVDSDKVYSKEDFDADVKLFLPFGLLIAVLLLPLVTVDESNIPTMEDFLDGITLFNNSTRNLELRLNETVTDFIKLGVL